ncbi:alpha/beta hydrolase [Nocardioides sp. SR21]|uniref:alpha/beta hydrolase n=1 Tax=Nocardioides sp. SR21 TaxID=2919501 RepID=UPI001FAB0FDA|nr:alpha/beta hydrolase [Nocardioides sp. SR21]
MSEPRLVEIQRPREPRGQVLVLHGGASRPGSTSVSPAQLSVLRMVPIAQRIARADRSLAVVRVLNSRRGWDTERTPVTDVDWALDELRERNGSLPTCLVGHSLGGRAAILAGDADGVRGVVALNPWVYPHDDADLSGRRVLIVHGTEDRVAPIERARAVARNLSRRTDVELVEVPGGKHAMLRHGRTFEVAASRFATDVL